MKKVLEYTENQNIIEVDGIEYKIPLRTAGLEKKLVEREIKITEMTEYESNMMFLEIMFGKDAYKMFPEGEDTNLDKLAMCVKIVADSYLAQHREIQNESLKQSIESVKPLISTVDKLKKAKI